MTRRIVCTSCTLALLVVPGALIAQERPTPKRRPPITAPRDARPPRLTTRDDTLGPRFDKDRWLESQDMWHAKSFDMLYDKAFDMAHDMSLDMSLSKAFDGSWDKSFEMSMDKARDMSRDMSRDIERSAREFAREAERATMFQQREIDRDVQRDAAQMAREMQREASKIGRDIQLDAIKMAREAHVDEWRMSPKLDKLGTMEALSMQGALMDERMAAKLAQSEAFAWKSSDLRGLLAPSRFLNSNFPDDPADSLYRQARELLNRGEWRRAATVFREIPVKFPNSAYAPDALYWQAFALYRIGGSSELRDALSVLDAQRGKYPGARTQSDASALATRIRGALASRGDAAAAAQISRTANDSTTRCDQEELAVRIEALSSLSQADPDGAAPIIQKVLARRDECSVQLRRNAVFLLVNKRRDAAAVAQLTQVARTDPSPEVRSTAIEWMSRMPGEEVVATLEELAKSSDDERLQRAAVRGLMMNPTPRARAAVRALIERNDTPDKLRAEALGAFSGERATSEDVTWLRGMYAKSDNPRMKARIVAALARVGGAEVDQWLVSLARNTEEDSEIRSIALRRVSRTLAIPDLAKLYDQSADRPSREMLIGALSERGEAEATDKLIDIVKSGTDPQLRRSAIGALTRKKDPRTTRLLMEIVDR